MNTGVQKIKEVIMTETIKLQEAFKNRNAFSELMSTLNPPEISTILEPYTKQNAKTIIKIAELTQNIDTVVNVLGDSAIRELPQSPYLVWIITNEKQKIMDLMQTINQHANNGFGIFVFKASLNGDKIDFKCLLKPQLVVKQKREVNTNTPSKQLQKSIWEKYIDICDASEYPDMQIKEAAPQHYQNISIGKSGVQILQTINTQNKYVASEISINNNKEIFEKLFEHKDEIEKEIGTLKWDSKENVKSAKIRKTFEVDVNNPENHEMAIAALVKMGAELKAIVHKYL